MGVGGCGGAMLVLLSPLRALVPALIALLIDSFVVIQAAFGFRRQAGSARGCPARVSPCGGSVRGRRPGAAAALLSRAHSLAGSWLCSGVVVGGGSDPLDPLIGWGGWRLGAARVCAVCNHGMLFLAPLDSGPVAWLTAAVAGACALP